MEKELEAHLRRAEKTIEAAMTLYNAGFHEDAISRGYYAMYHVAKAALILKNIDTKSHKGLIAKFGEEYVKVGELSRENMKELSHGFRLRMKSDYDVDFEMGRDEVLSFLEDARDFVESVSEYVRSKVDG